MIERLVLKRGTEPADPLRTWCASRDRRPIAFWESLSTWSSTRMAYGFMRVLIVQNQISAFLAYHSGGHVSVRVDDERHDRGVHHAQTLHPVDAQMRIHHGKR